MKCPNCNLEMSVGAPRYLCFNCKDTEAQVTVPIPYLDKDLTQHTMEIIVFADVSGENIRLTDDSAEIIATLYNRMNK